MSRRPRITGLLLLIVTFAVGGLAGMAVEEATGIDWFEFLDRDKDKSRGELLEGLDLSRDQRERAEDALERQEDLLEDYWKNRMPEIQGVLEQSYAEIRALLTPKQRTIFDRRVRKLDGRPPERDGD